MKIKKVSKFLGVLLSKSIGFLVCWFLDFSVSKFLGFKESKIQKAMTCFGEDIDPILLGELVEKLWQKSSVGLFCFNLDSSLFDVIMGETENPSSL